MPWLSASPPCCLEVGCSPGGLGLCLGLVLRRSPCSCTCCLATVGFGNAGVRVVHGTAGSTATLAAAASCALAAHGRPPVGWACRSLQPPVTAPPAASCARPPGALCGVLCGVLGSADAGAAPAGCASLASRGVTGTSTTASRPPAGPLDAARDKRVLGETIPANGAGATSGASAGTVNTSGLATSATSAAPCCIACNTALAFARSLGSTTWPGLVVGSPVVAGAVSLACCCCSIGVSAPVPVPLPGSTPAAAAADAERPLGSFTRGTYTMGSCLLRLLLLLAPDSTAACWAPA